MDQNQTTSQAPSDLPILSADDKKVETHTMAQDLKNIQTKTSEPALQMRVPQIKPNEAKPIPLEIPPIAKTAERVIPTPPKPPLMEKPTSAPSASSMFEKFRRPKEVSPVPESVIPSFTKVTEDKPDISKFKGAVEEMPKQTVPAPTIPTPSTPIPTPKPLASEIRPIPKPLGVPMPEKKLEIYIPPVKSKLPLIAASAAVVILLAAGGGFGYWWFYVKAPSTPTEIPTPEAPEVVPPPTIETPEQPIEQPSVVEIPEIKEIPEPQSPTSVIITDQTMVTTIESLDSLELSKNLKADTSGIIGEGTITQHFVKLSNQSDKRFLKTNEILNLLNISIPETIWQQTSNANLISYKLNNSLRYGIVIKISAKDPVMALMKNWEPNIVNDIKQLFMGEPITIPEDSKFVGNTYLDFDKRYLNLMSTETSIDYAVSNKYLIIATSKDMMFATILQTQK